MDQSWFCHVLENPCKPLDTILMWCTTAFERCVYMREAKTRRFSPAERIGAAIGAVAPQIDDGADAVTPRCQASLPRQRVVGPVKTPRRNHAPIAPTQTQDRVVNEKRIAPGVRGRHAPLFQPRA